MMEEKINSLYSGEQTAFCTGFVFRMGFVLMKSQEILRRCDGGGRTAPVDWFVRLKHLKFLDRIE